MNKFTGMAEIITNAVIADRNNEKYVMAFIEFESHEAAKAALTVLSTQATATLSEYFPERADDPYKITNSYVSSRIREAFNTIQG